MHTLVTRAASVAILVALAGCSKKVPSSDASPNQLPVASAPSAAAPVSPPVDARAARKTQYCARHDAMKHLISPKCQACLKGPPPKEPASCMANGTAFKACVRAAPAAKNQSSLQCAAACGVACACSLDCFENDMPECFDAYLATVDCVAAACEAACK